MSFAIWAWLPDGYKPGQGDQANALSVPDGAHETGLRDFAISTREEEGALV